uniref:Polygalacturonase n=1 Tax=Acrobeloides nanus TaxID=290746 RepID=A0A914DP51_9BILA
MYWWVQTYAEFVLAMLCFLFNMATFYKSVRINKTRVNPNDQVEANKRVLERLFLIQNFGDLATFFILFIPNIIYAVGCQYDRWHCIAVHVYIQLVRTQDYHVLNYGAVGDGKQDDTVAVRSTFSAAANGGFNVSSNIIIDIRGTILGSTNTTLYQWNSAYWHPLILASNVQNVTMTGGGLIDGNGSIWWKCARTNNSLPPCENKSRPNLFYVGNGKNITIMNVTFKNSPGSGITFETIENGYIGNISILAPSSGDQNDPSINTDAIDIWRSVNVLVENSYISVGDVAFALESSYDIPNQNITIRNMTIGNSHGLALGSFQNGGNQNILFENIIINGSDKLDTGPNIISAPGRGGKIPCCATIVEKLVTYVILVRIC